MLNAARRFDPTVTESDPAPAPNLHVLPPPAGLPAKPKPAKAGLNFGSLAVKSPVPAGKPGEHILPDPDGKIAALADDFLDAEARETAASAAKEIARLALIQAARPYHFQQNRGRTEPESSVTALRPATAAEAAAAVRVTFKNAYPKMNEARYLGVTQILGEDLAAEFFRQKFELSIKSDNIPDDLLQTVLDKMAEIAAELRLPALVEAKPYFAPVAAWHEARYSRLTPEINLALEATDPVKGFCTVAVGLARGRK